MYKAYQSIPYMTMWISSLVVLRL